MRAPFVTTIATTLLTVACSGEDAHVPYNPPSPQDAAFDAVPAIDPRCPKSLPADGDTCSADLESLLCGYPGECSDGETRACIHGRWGIVPSFCDSTGSPCPTDLEPREGEPCAVPSGMTCQYFDACPAVPTDKSRTWVCQGKQWVLAIDQTKGYPATCPATMPNDGDYCVCFGRLPSECTYGDCGGYPSTIATCDTGTWKLTFKSCAPDAG